MALKVSSSSLDMNIKMTNLAKIENYLNDSSYSELIDHSASFNSRLSIERKLRLPFLDPQTGVAQNHSNLFMKKSQRIPGLRGGQIYTYPSQRWRTTRKRQYLFHREVYQPLNSTNHHNSTSSTAVTNNQPTSAITSENGESNELAFPSEESNSMAGDTDSKDSQNIKEESMISSKEWYYDDILEPNEVGSEEQGDSDFEFSLNGYKRKKRVATTRKSTSRKPKAETDGVKKSRSSSSGGAGGNRSSSANRSSRKSSSKSSKSKSSKSEKIVDPPSFDSMQSDFMEGSADGFGSYRSF